MTIPLAPIIGIISAPAIQGAALAAMQGNFEQAVNFVPALIGIRSDTKAFDAGLLFMNMTPIIIGALVHKFVGGRPLNINGMLAKANVPYVRI
jgi:hypothetical protein